MDMKLKDKIVAITGGAGDIGSEIAEEFLNEGCKVAVCGRTQKSLDAFKEKIIKSGKDILIKSADVSSMAEVEAFAQAITDTYGGIDIWVNCAGMEGYSPLIECTEEFWNKVIDVNLTGTWRGIKAASQGDRCFCGKVRS